MTEDDKKLLTEFLGECWHEFKPLYEDGVRCIYCGIYHCKKHDPRDFTTWQDLGDLKDKLVGERQFEKFYVYAVKNWAYEPRSSDFTQWLLNLAIFIPLVVEFLKKEKV